MGLRSVLNGSGITLYHGTSATFEQPVFGFGKSDNDYGSGFYLTPFFERAAEWACEFGNDSGFVNEYRLDTSGLRVLNFDSLGPLCWIAEVAYNRVSPEGWWSDFYDEFLRMYRWDTSSYDAIVGLRADDSYLDVVREFFNGSFGAFEIERMFKEGDLGSQFFIKSEKAFRMIKFYRRVPVSGYLNSMGKARESNITKMNNRRAQLLINKNLSIEVPTFSDSLDRQLVFNREGRFYE